MNKKISLMPETEQPREKLFAKGARSLSTTELLAILLRTGTREKSALDLATEVLTKEKMGLRGFSNYEAAEFSSIEGIGPAKACSLCAAIELGRRIATAPPMPKVFIDGPSDVARLFMEEMRSYTKEVFKVVMLNIKKEMILSEDISIGSINSSLSNPREVFAGAIKKGAFAIILVHNHPSGDPTPSQSDITTTAQLASAGALLGIEVLDHILIGDGKYTSFKEANLF